MLDGQVYRTEEFDRKTKEFRGIKGRRISGNTNVQAKREKEAADSMMRSVGTIAAMGAFFTDNQKDANDWKARMLKAGLQGKGFQMPEDWDTLSEDEKQRRLDGVIAISLENK